MGRRGRVNARLLQFPGSCADTQRMTKREQVQRKDRRSRDRRERGPLPLDPREIFFPYPIKPAPDRPARPR